MTTDARLRAFVAVADSGSVHAAAGRLLVTDSAISAAIAALTREVGVPLLERQGRGLRLTPSGQTYAGYARAILGMHAEAMAAARGDADPEHGRVRVAAVTTAAEHILPPVLATFRDRHPGIDVGLEVGPSDQVWGLVADWGADLVIAGRPPRAANVVVRAVRPNALVVVGSPTRAGLGSPAPAGVGSPALAGVGSPARAGVGSPGPAGVGSPGRAGAPDVLHQTWLMREVGSGTRTTCEALLASLDADPATLTLGSNGAVVAGAVAGLGVTLVSRDAVADRLAAGDLIELPVPHTPLRRPWHAVTRPRASAAADLLVAHLLATPEWRRPRRRPTAPATPATNPA